MTPHKWIGLAIALATAILGVLQSQDLTPLIGSETSGIVLACIGALNAVLHSIPVNKP